MSGLEQVWQGWRALSRTEKAQFLALFREQYARERAVVRRRNGGGAHGERVSSLSDLTLVEADLQRLRS
jgi:hypothetical protein